MAGAGTIDAVKFIRDMNTEIYAADPGAVTLARIDCLAAGVSSGSSRRLGVRVQMEHGLDARHAADIHRRAIPSIGATITTSLTFGLLYAFSENFILPLSHDEVVHGKALDSSQHAGRPLAELCNLRAYYAFMWCHPGKKLIFMGGEFGQEQEWAHEHSLDWHLIADPMHRSVQDLVRELNRLYRATPALHRLDSSPDGFSWVDANDADNSVLSFLRFAPSSPPVLVVCNFTPVVREGYRVGVPVGGYWRERINTDAACYGGSNVGNAGGLVAEGTSCHNRPFFAATDVAAARNTHIRACGWLTGERDGGIGSPTRVAVPPGGDLGWLGGEFRAVFGACGTGRPLSFRPDGPPRGQPHHPPRIH
jgi:1,4-alpha-glucan branching enzyme